MNLQEYLLVSLGEECSEVTQAAAKALRFGLDDRYPDPGKSLPASEYLCRELNDLFAVVEMLQTHNFLPLNCYDKELVRIKKEKVYKYMAYARQRKALNDSVSETDTGNS